MSAGNLAIIYRDAGDLRSAFRWWKRAAGLRDGDAMVDVAYCYQYGIGVRKNISEARKLFRGAISSREITAYGRGEATYGLAVSFVDLGQNARAVPLLKAASADGSDSSRPLCTAVHNGQVRKFEPDETSANSCRS